MVADDHGAQARLRCVDAGLGRASELVRLLRDATDRETFDHAVTAVATLPEPTRCLGAPASPLPTADQADRVRAVQRRLDTVRALRATGRYRSASVEARAAADSASHTEFAPVRAEALLLVGDLQGRLNEPTLAEEALWQAIEVAGSEAPGVTARAWTRLVEVVGREAADPDRGLHLASIAEAEVRRGGEELVLADLMLSRAVVLVAVGRHDEAIEAATRGVELRERLLPGDHPGRAQALTTLATTLRSRGHTARAREALERALEINRVALGKHHPTTNRTRNLLAPAPEGLLPEAQD